MFRRVKTPSSGMVTVEPAGRSPDGARTSCCKVGCSTALLVVYAHLCLFFGIGISTSLTVFLDDIVHEFDSSITTLGIFFSVRALTFGVTSPLASFLANRFGSRVVIMGGGFLTAAGVMMTAWATGVALIGVGVVCLTGIGSALVYIATLISIRRNFPDSRSYALANGITVSGSSLAVSVFAPITRVLSDTYNWRGALLISSAIILHTMVFGALLKDRKVIPKGRRERLNDSASAIALIDNTTNSRVTLNGDPSPVKQSISNGHGSGHLENGNGHYAESTLMTSFDGSEAHEVTESFEHHEHVQPEVAAERTKEPILADVPTTILHGLLLFVIFLSTSSYSAVFVYLAAAGTERGLTPIESAGLLSATGISQAVVRFGHGFLVTVGFIKPLPLYIIVQLIMTIGILVLGIFQQYSVGCFAAVMFGIGTGSVRSLNMVVQKVVDKRSGSTALGIVGLVSEVAAAAGGLFAGLLRDRSGEYLASFMVACGMTFAATLLSGVIMLLKRFLPCQPKNHVLTLSLKTEP